MVTRATVNLRVPGASVHAFSARSIDGTLVPLNRFAGSVLLIVNVASRCGFTPQYAGLERVHRTYRDRGFSVLAFPCNQFGGQEPGTDEEIRAFCASTFDVTFPVFAKVRVNGPAADPLFVHLKSTKRGWLGVGRISWNFTKFLIDRRGRVVGRFAPATAPAALVPDIERLLAEPRPPGAETFSAPVEDSGSPLR